MLKVTVYCHASSFFAGFRSKSPLRSASFNTSGSLYGVPSLIVVAITVLTTSSVADREDSAVPSFVVERGTAVLITKAKRAVSLPFVMDVSHDLA